MSVPSPLRYTASANSKSSQRTRSVNSRASGSGNSARFGVSRNDDANVKCVPEVLRRVASLEQLHHEAIFNASDHELAERNISRDLDFGRGDSFGVFRWPDGTSYAGEVRELLAHGYGVKRGASGWIFAGTFIDGNKEGAGLYVWPSNARYIGAWQNERPHGLGLYLEQERTLYGGTWSSGLKTEHGVERDLATGRTYAGTWRRGAKDGLGVETYADGGIFRGQFRNGKRDGFGIRTYVHDKSRSRSVKPLIYIGMWRNDQRHGRGEQRYSDGTCYRGNWENNVRKGVGLLRSLSQVKMKSGKWADDGLVEEYSKRQKTKLQKVSQMDLTMGNVIREAKGHATRAEDNSRTAQQRLVAAERAHLDALRVVKTSITIINTCLQLELNHPGPDSILSRTLASEILQRLPMPENVEPVVVTLDPSVSKSVDLSRHLISELTDKPLLAKDAHKTKEVIPPPSYFFESTSEVALVLCIFLISLFLLTL
eukprot:TRINITY_DN7651_c0_g1_i3.p1 TRINITY_DN7651_c0_g1~~TRINITY_DN7651_c0_g1_i3.p1  ORF type:complete len:483 (+),score=66.82 TRINITY_DN7651_c0_g1_i3:101-1549(+)